MSKSGKERLNLKCLKTGTGYIVTRTSQLSEAWISGADNCKNLYSSLWLLCRNRLMLLDNSSFLLGMFWARMGWANYFGFLPDCGRGHIMMGEKKKRSPWAVTSASYFWSRHAFCMQNSGHEWESHKSQATRLKIRGGIPDRNLTFLTASLTDPFQRNKNWNAAWTKMQSSRYFSLNHEQGRSGPSETRGQRKPNAKAWAVHDKKLKLPRPLDSAKH